MARTNVAVEYAPVLTHEGAVAQRITPLEELKRTVLTCMLFEQTFYESGCDIATRIAELVPKVAPEAVARLAVEARDAMKLRHAPLYLTAQLSKIPGTGPLVEDTLVRIIQRADELAEFLSIYWQYGIRDGAKKTRNGKHALSAGVKRGLRAAFQRFDAYALGKYNRDNAIKLRDVLFMVHPKPKDQEQAEVWKRLVDGTLESPDTWEVALSGGADKRETFERLMREGKLGGLAVLRNLRNMIGAGVDEALIRERLSKGISKALPFRFVTAARYAPQIEDAIESAMLSALEGADRLPGKTGLLIDVSGSMDAALNAKSETNRIDAACGLAILLREIGEHVRIATFSEGTVIVPSRRGFALRDAVTRSQPHSSTYLKKSLDSLRSQWSDVDRIIVITDEQSHDGIATCYTPRGYVVNVAPYKNGVGYGNGWMNVNGWSERIVDFIAEYERAASAA